VIRPHNPTQWLIPLVPVGLGGVILTAEAIDGQVVSGLVWFAVLTAVGVLGIFGGRFEEVREARGDTEDERDRSINTRALAVAGLVWVLALTGCIVFQLARGDDTSPYAQLMAVGGASYAIALLALRRIS
jgi:hypothetical protein